MEFRAGSFDDIELCLVSTFRLNVPFRTGSNSDSGLLGAYGDWKADVKSELKKKSDSYSLIWDDPKKSQSDHQNFVAGCFLESRVENFGSSTSPSARLDAFANLSLEVTFLEIRLWEFGFGSVKVGVSFASLESDEITEKEIISELKDNKFCENLELLIESEIICRCKSGDGSDSSTKSFAEKVIHHKEMEIEYQVGKLSEHQALIQINVEDSEFSAQADLLSKSLYNIHIEEDLPAENFGIFCSKEKDVIIFLQVANNDSSERIAEMVLIQVSFLQYASAVGKIYLIFFVANLKKLYKAKSFWGPIEKSKLNPRGRESIIVEERRKVNLIYAEIEIISQVIYESNYQMNSLFASGVNVANCRIHNGLSSILNFTALQSIVKNEYNNIEYKYNKIDKIASHEESIGQARSYQFAGTIASLFIFFFRGYFNDLTQDYSLPLVVLIIIILYVLRNFLHRLWSRVFEQFDIYRYKKNSASLSDDKLWILMDKKTNIKKMYWICWLGHYSLGAVIFFIKLIEYLYWFLLIFIIMYLLIIGNPQTPNPRDPETPSNPPAQIDTSLSPKVHFPDAPTSTILVTTTSFPAEIQPTSPSLRQSKCFDNFFTLSNVRMQDFFGDNKQESHKSCFTFFVPSRF